MKKGGGIGPLKPWQPVHYEKGAKSDPSDDGKDKFSSISFKLLSHNDV